MKASSTTTPALFFSFLYAYLTLIVFMKRILLSTLVILSLYFSAHAQLAKGSWMVGGSLGLSSTTTPQYQGNYTTTQVIVSPKAGYFFIDRLTAGLSINSS